MRVNFGLLMPAMCAQYTAPTWVMLVAGFFVLFALSISMYLIFEHLSAYNNPEEQKFVLGVILMVPCYAIESARPLKKCLGEYVIKDLKFTVNQAVRPLEKQFDKLMKKNDKYKKNQDDNWVSAASPERPVRGIDDLLLSGCSSDSGKKHRRAVSSVAAVDIWGGGDQTSDGYEIRGRRWAVKN